jgi:hypothetical protein
MDRRCLVAFAWAFGIGVARPALAHAPPQATDVRWLGERAIVRTNRGFILEDEPGGSFRLLCNDAFHASLSEVPAVAVTSDGQLLVSTYEAGLLRSSPDHCSFEPVPGTEGLIVAGLAGDSQQGFYSAVIPKDGSASTLLVSQDDGASFERRTELDGVPTGVVIAPSDATRVHVAISSGDGESLSARLLGSADAGYSFDQAMTIELYPSELRAFLLGVDPENPERVFVRTQSRDAVIPERLLLRESAGGAFVTVLETFGPISLAWDAEGIVWVGGAGGLYRWDIAAQTLTSGTSFDVSRVACLATRAGLLYVCGFHAGEFGVLVSSNSGVSFDWFLRFPEVTARLGCPATSDEATNCASAFADWSLEQGLGMPEPRAGSGGQAGGSAGASGQPSGGLGASGAPSSAAGSTSETRSEATPGCAIPPAPPPAERRMRTALGALAACFFLLARSSRSPRSRHRRAAR